jgi:hypothetical protein
MSRSRHGADTRRQAAAFTLHVTSTRGDPLLKRVYTYVVHEFGNGRAVANTQREAHRERFAHERIEALARRLAPAATQPGGRPAA